MTLTDAVKNSFVSGLILLTPLVVTLFVLRILVNWSLQFVDPVVQGTRLTLYTGNEVAAQLVAAVLILAAITLVGYLAQKSIGQHLFGNIGRTVNFIPLVNTLYASVRQVATSLVERNTGYEGVALVEYPREGVYAIGLVTGDGPPEMEAVADEELYAVFLPHSPNPTAGRLLYLPGDQVHEIDMSVRRGMRLVVTTGMGAESESNLLPELAEENGLEPKN
ncbi:DUF502 domain-containing protein [Halomicroarcula sp. GCM10025817]|uniref:DUF502 domain-containing protein n=1 Tax=Haloarcula TaxID=2237 RepID=UPI0023E8AE70|nr:DUF502 domain-containing protein [Halomicroarcula sp. SYNS111]